MRIVLHRRSGDPQIRLEDTGEFGSLRIEPADPEHSISTNAHACFGRPPLEWISAAVDIRVHIAPSG